MTRAVHIELVESMSTSSFINALRRFFSVRGTVQYAKLLRSDRGTNFIGACKELKIDHNDAALNSYLQERNCVWQFNPPHSSHMGGSWERLIGIARRILDAMLLQSVHTRLTHEVLSTLMAEVMAIINEDHYCQCLPNQTCRLFSRLQWSWLRRPVLYRPHLATLTQQSFIQNNGNKFSVL